MQLFLIYTTISCSLSVGLLFFCLVAGAISSETGRSSRAQELESSHTTARMIRNWKKIDMLYEIGKPNLSSGGYSEDKMELWHQYFRLEKEDQELTKQEWAEEIDAEGYFQ